MRSRSRPCSIAFLLFPPPPPAPASTTRCSPPATQAPAWENLEGTDGKKHSLADLKDRDVVVVVFTCNSCPVATAYEDRIMDFAGKYASKPDAKVAVVAINVNTGKDDALPAMTARAQKRKFNFTYLYDPSQQIARKYGALFTPEFFVLDKDRKVIYSARWTTARPASRAIYLDRAVSPGEKPETAETAAGCKIKFNAKADDQ